MWTDGGGSCRGWGKVSGWKKIGGQRANRKGGRVPPADCRPKPCCSAGGANAGHRLQCMVKRRPKLFPARLLLSSLRGRWLPNWVGPLGLGIEHLSNEVVLYRRSNKSATSSPTFSPRNSTSSANCRIISCVSGNGVMRSPPWVFSDLVTGHLRQTADRVAFKAPMQGRPGQMRDRRLQSIEAVVQRQQCMLAEGDDDRFFLRRQHCRVRRFRPHRGIVVLWFSPCRAAGSLSGAFDRCIAVRTACVVVAQP
jgi:hypothetical protein